KGVIVTPTKVMDGAEILEHQKLVQEVVLAPHVQDYVARLILATHPDGKYAAPATNQYLRWGASPRGAQTVALAAKVAALLGGRYNVSFEDVRRVYLPALRHRVILNFEAEAESIDPDQVLKEILKAVPEKAEEAAA
ncbi:MAG: AAA family ATPase, partial [Planctomycetota bacterium]